MKSKGFGTQEHCLFCEERTWTFQYYLYELQPSESAFRRPQFLYRGYVDSFTRSDTSHRLPPG